MNRLTFAGLVIAMAFMALYVLAAPAHAAVKWQIAGKSGQHCYNASAAWALFSAAVDLGAEGGQLDVKVWFPPADDPFVEECLAERDRRRNDQDDEQSQ